jgi:putative FmdB family regulatory protein
MPIYDYACRGCGEKFELLVLKNTVLECPSCKGSDLEQQLVTDFAVSSESTRQAHLQKARERHKNSKDVKDKMVAEAEEVREHSQ